MTEKKPADDAARQAIRSRLDVTMLVEAAAGTGKTTSLVARMVNLVRSGLASASHIAAITFTVKAAAQLRERFQEDVERAIVQEMAQEAGGASISARTNPSTSQPSRASRSCQRPTRSSRLR